MKRTRPFLMAALTFLFVITAVFHALIADETPTKVKSSPIRPDNLQTEYFTDPIGIDEQSPVLTWGITTSGANIFDRKQTAYRILVGTSDIGLLEGNQEILWDSGWVDSGDSYARYGGDPLVSNQTYYWNVRIRDNEGLESKPSAMGRWTTGLLDQSEWIAEWIGTGEDFTSQGDGSDRPFDPRFRKDFKLDEQPKQALFHIASIGYHEVYVNGLKIDSGILTPCVSDHSHRARYVTYDITRALRPGDNVIAVLLGTGWSIYSVYEKNGRPNAPIFMAQCEIKSEGVKGPEIVRVVTDDTWLTSPSGNKLLGNWGPGNYGGEYQDGSVSDSDWNLLKMNDAPWKPVTVYHPELVVSAQNVQNNRGVERIEARGIEKTGDNIWRVDMGKNFAGWMEIDVEGDPGDLIQFEFSESPLASKTFNLFSQYKIGPTGHGTFKNRFNYSSGRWITVTGLKKEPKLDQFRGMSIRTDYQDAATFECSDPLQNWIYNTVLWTFENLSVGGYVVDCPQRERMGYGGDAHATCETGMFNYHMEAFYHKWMEDWRDVQGWHQDWLDEEANIVPGREEAITLGTLPNTAPTYWGGGGPAWGGIVVTLPWFYYQHYGDKRILEENFDLIIRWLEFFNSYVENGLLRRYGNEWNFLGDWLWPGAPDGPNSDTEDTLCLNNIYRIYNLKTAAKIARTIGRNEEAEKWEQLAVEGRNAIQETYFHPEDASYFDGRMSIQAAALLAEIPTPDLRPKVMERLEKEILENQNGHIGAGITGGALLFKLLRQEGRDDLIYSMASQTTYPGWGFMRVNDATTIWEAWELNRPGHSLLHSSYLYVGSWYIDSVLGIRSNPESPGFGKIVIHPPKLSDTPLEWAKGSFDSRHGKITVDWKKREREGQFVLTVGIPVNATATIYVPTDDPNSTRASTRAKWVRNVPGYSVFEVGSGDYNFRSPYSKPGIAKTRE